MRPLILTLILLGGAADYQVNTLTTATRTVHVDMTANAAVVGATAPTRTTVGTFAGYGFDDANDEMLVVWETGTDWVAATPPVLRIYWTNEPGTPIPDTKKVIWAISYRVKDDGDDLDAGTATVGSVPYTQAGGGTDGTLHESNITLTYNDANNPIVVEDNVGISIKRDTATEAGDTYAADAVILKFEIVYSSNTFKEH